MIFADKIINERKKNGWSQEELAERISVSRQAVSKWESAQSVPDLQRVIQLADLFGVSTDYLLRDEIEDKADSMAIVGDTEELTMDNPSLHKVSMEEANAYIVARQETAPKIANAVSMCIVSPCVLILLAGLAEYRGICSEGLAVGVGMLVLLGLIAMAVFTFITMGVKTKRFEFLESEGFETAYGVSGMIRARKEEYAATAGLGIGIGVVLCILAALPLIIAGAMGASDMVCIVFTCTLLIFVSAGVNIIIRVGSIQGCYDSLLQEGEYTIDEKRFNKKYSSIKGAYWCVATAIYLGWSFATQRWDFTWLVWPVAGVLFAAFCAVLKQMYERNN